MPEPAELDQSRRDARAGGPLLYQHLDTTAAFPYSFGEYARRFAWEWVQRTLIRFSPRRATGWRRFWLRAFGARIGAHSGTRPTTRVFHPWLLTIGEWSHLSDGVTIYNLGAVEIGSHTVLSQDVYICAGSHDYRRANLPLVRPRIRIGSGVWICAGSFIGPGVRVGDNTIVGARAVVMRDAPEAMILSGNPAQVVRPRPLPATEAGS
jgi:putative colanic acid biosynthesis acetyltransferase WcaF